VAELIGIARLAAQSPQLEAKRRVEYFDLASRSYITKCDSERVPFDWTINPYRGCEFGCKYCYARYAHEFMELRQPDDFERKIYVKHFDPARFRDELRRIPKARPCASAPPPIRTSLPSAATASLARSSVSSQGPPGSASVSPLNPIS